MIHLLCLLHQFSLPVLQGQFIALFLKLQGLKKDDTMFESFMQHLFFFLNGALMMTWGGGGIKLLRSLVVWLKLRLRVATVDSELVLWYQSIWVCRVAEWMLCCLMSYLERQEEVIQEQHSHFPAATRVCSLFPVYSGTYMHTAHEWP